MRTGAQRYLDCPAVQRALQPGDTVCLNGVVDGPLVVSVDGVQLQGPLEGGYGELRPAERAPKEQQSTLIVRAHNVRVRRLRIWTHKKVDHKWQTPAVLVGWWEGSGRTVDNFFMSNCEIVGHGADTFDFKWNDRYGHSGIDLRKGVSVARFDDVVIRDLSGNAVIAHFGVTARFNNFRAKRVGCTGVLLEGAGGCAFQSVHVEDCGIDGFYLDAMATCTLLNCSALRSGNAGLVCDIPFTLLGNIIPQVLLTKSHDIRGLRSFANGTYGVLFKAGATAMLHESNIEGNCLNGIRIANSTPRAGATALIRLHHVTLRKNGLEPGLKPELEEDAAIAAERIAGGASMLVQLDLQHCKVFMEGNGKNSIVEVDDEAAQ